MRKLILVFVTISLFAFSCNLGLKSGADIEGTWYAKDLLGILRWTFNDDNTGEHRSFYIKSDTFTWDVKQAVIYNVFVVDWDDDSRTKEYLYYFNPGKTKLYIKARYDEDDFWTKYSDKESAIETLLGL